MIVARHLDPDTAVGAGWRLARGYVISRRLPGYWLLMAILLVVVVWGSAWGKGHAPATLHMLVFLLPVATASVIGVSLSSPFGETERAAGTWLPLGRVLHLLTMLAVALVINRVSVATWVPEDDAGQWEHVLLRHTLLLTGIALLAARVIDSRLSWIAPALVAMPGLAMGYIRVEQAEAEGQVVAFFHRSWHPMLHPADSVMATSIAAGLVLAGVGAVVRRGERLAEPEAAAG